MDRQTVTVRLLSNAEIIEEREMDRVPVVGEVVCVDHNNEILHVARVYWREDGRASVILSNVPK